MQKSRTMLVLMLAAFISQSTDPRAQERESAEIRKILFQQEKDWDHGVEVLFRPFHEMNQALFWWGGRPGPEGTARLYQLTHDYLSINKGPSNLIWAWDMQDLNRDFGAYDPGPEYGDVFAFDIYDKGYDRSWYDYLLPIVGSKPVAIGECSRLPTARVLETQPRWVFFMPLAGLVKESNAPEQIREAYKHPSDLTLDEMPAWKSTES